MIVVHREMNVILPKPSVLVVEISAQTYDGCFILFSPSPPNHRTTTLGFTIYSIKINCGVCGCIGLVTFPQYVVPTMAKMQYGEYTLLIVVFC